MGLKAGFAKLAPNVNVIGVEPDNPFHGLEGLKHMASSIVPGIYKQGVLDEIMPADTEVAYQTVNDITRQTGLMMGPSGAASLNAAIAKAKTNGAGVYLAMIPDNGTRYMTTQVWQSTLTEEHL